MVEQYDAERRDDAMTVKHALKAPAKQDGVELLRDFIAWVVPRWKVFWACFGTNGAMLWPTFSDFVTNGAVPARLEQGQKPGTDPHHCFGKQYQLGKWVGDTRRVFELLCEEGCDYLTPHQCLDARRQVEIGKDCCEWGLKGLRHIFFRKFGSLVHAWRRIFDPGRTGRCSKVTFLKQVRFYGFHGSLNTTWTEITGGELNRNIVLADWDPESDRMLERFAIALVAKYGSLKEAWADIMNNAHDMHVPVFMELVKGLGFQPKEARKIFQCFDKPDFGAISGASVISEAMSEENFEFLSYWDPALPHRAAVATPGITGMPSTPGSNQPSPDRQKFPGSADDASVVGINAPALAFEFTVILTPAEYNEYLRRKRSLRLPDDPRTPCMITGTSRRTSVSSAPVSPATSTGFAHGKATVQNQEKADAVVSPSPAAWSPRRMSLSPRGAAAARNMASHDKGAVSMDAPGRQRRPSDNTLGGLFQMTIRE